MKTVELSSGVIVVVYPVPPFALTSVETLHCDKGHAERERLVRETAWLLALPNVTPPADWQFPRALEHAGIEPRAGAHGRLLDYIEYGLLATPADVRLVQHAMYGALAEGEIGAAEAAFRPNGGGAESTTDPV